MRLEQLERNRTTVKKTTSLSVFNLPSNGPVFHCSVVLEINIGTELVALLYEHEHLFLSLVSV